MENNLKAIVFGGSGSVGQAIINALFISPKVSKVTLILRRGMKLDKCYSKFEQEIVEFERIEDYHHIFQRGYDIGFYAIGIAPRKDDPSTFRKIEVENASRILSLLQQSRVLSLHFVSAMHASINSNFQIYKIKGEAEEIAKNVGFKQLSIYRVGGVLNEDGGSRGLSPILYYLLKYIDIFRMYSIQSNDFGRAIVANAIQNFNAKKTEILEHSQIIQLAK